MKKILFLGLMVSLLFASSCSVDDTTAEFYFELIPVESVEMPVEFIFGATHTITVTYKRPTSCHTFSSFEYVQRPDNVRNVAVVNFVTSGNNCQTLEEDFRTESFSFSALNSEPYTFNFWQGKDANGEDMYLTYEINVSDN
jgi:hypothetical protein